MPMCLSLYLFFLKSPLPFCLLLSTNSLRDGRFKVSEPDYKVTDSHCVSNTLTSQNTLSDKVFQKANKTVFQWKETRRECLNLLFLDVYYYFENTLKIEKYGFSYVVNIYCLT